MYAVKEIHLDDDDENNSEMLEEREVQAIRELNSKKYAGIANIASSGGNETMTEEDEVLEELVNLQDEAKRLAAEAKAEAKPQNDEEWLRDNAMKSPTPSDKGSEEDKKDVVKKRKTSNDVYLEAMQEKKQGEEGRTKAEAGRIGVRHEER